MDINVFDLNDHKYWSLEELAKNCRCFCIDPRNNLIILIGTKYGSVFTVNLGEIFTEHYFVGHCVT